MGLFENLPYTNLHELNLSWFLVTFKELLHEWDEQQTQFHDLEEAWQALHDYVENYFDNLDVQQEINNKLDEMMNDGTLPIMIAQYLGLFIIPEMYGAVGDGVTDDSAAFAACAAAVGSLGTMTLKPNTTYRVSVSLPAINIDGNNAVLKPAGGSYVLTFAAAGEKGRVIKDINIDCEGTTPSDGYNGIYIDGITDAVFENINIDNVGQYGIRINSGYGMSFNNIFIRKPSGILSGYGDAVHCLTSDIMFDHVTIEGSFVRGFYDIGFNMYNNIHIWIGVDLNINRSGSIGIEKRNGGMISNLYIDSLETGILINQITLLIVSNIHWLILEGQGPCNLLKNGSGSMQRLNNVVLDNIYINAQANTAVDYHVTSGGTPILTNIAPYNLPVARTYGTVPHDINQNAHVGEDRIRIMDEYISFNMDLYVDAAIPTTDALVTLTSYPMARAFPAIVEINGAFVKMVIGNDIFAPVALQAGDVINIYCVVPMR